MSDQCAFVILGIVALCVGWPTWVWVVAFGVVAVELVVSIVDAEL